MSDEIITNESETAEVKDTGSQVAPSKNSKVVFILASAVFATIVLYVMFFKKSADEERPVDINEIIVETSGAEPTRDSGINLGLEELVSDISEENDIFFEDDTILEVPELPELPTLSKDISRELERELKEELLKAEQKQKEDYFTKDEVNKMIEDRLNKFKSQQKEVSIVKEKKLTMPSSKETSSSLLEEDGKDKAKKLDTLKKSQALKERKGSPIFKMKSGSGITTKEKDVNSIIILDKDMLMDIQDTGGNIVPTRTADLSRAILQGKVIDAILESSINTDVKAPVRAIISRDVYAEYGKNILIPRGSRLIGDYQADIKRGQNRVMISWNRIIRVDGLSLNISATAVDNLGRGGVAGEVDNKYTEILGTAFLSTMLTIATAAATEQLTGSTGITNSGTATGDTVQSAGKASDFAIIDGTKDLMEKASDLVDEVAEQKPTIRISQGTKIIVMVNQDLTLPLYKNRK